LILKYQAPELDKSNFSFELSNEAAMKNYLVMKTCDMDLNKAFLKEGNSPLAFGSEFKPVSIIEPLFKKHPNWTRVKKILTEGSSWPLDPLDEEDRKKDLEEALSFGNHKGAEDNPDLLRELCNKDVIHGYSLVLPLKCAEKLEGLRINPMNIAHQNTIEDVGKIIGKDRLTNNMSMRFQSEVSLNDRVRQDELLPC
jgi:hypothetical protein